MAESRRVSSIKRLPSDQLHAIAFTLRKQDWECDGWSRSQEWLWSIIIAELERRHRRARTLDAQCHCELCVAPFPDELRIGAQVLRLTSRESGTIVDPF